MIDWTRTNPATLAAWTAYQAANERARQDYDLAAIRAPLRATDTCNACNQPVTGSALYCPTCRDERRRATYRRSQARKQRKATT